MQSGALGSLGYTTKRLCTTFLELLIWGDLTLVWTERRAIDKKSAILTKVKKSLRVIE